MTTLHTNNHIKVLNLSIEITITPTQIKSTYLSRRSDFGMKLSEVSEVVE